MDGSGAKRHHLSRRKTPAAANARSLPSPLLFTLSFFLVILRRPLMIPQSRGRRAWHSKQSEAAPLAKKNEKEINKKASRPKGSGGRGIKRAAECA